MSAEELEQVWEEAQSIDKEFESVALKKHAVFEILVPGEYWNHHGEQKPFVKKNSSVYIEEISEDKKQQFFEEYEKSWELLESGMPIYE